MAALNVSVFSALCFSKEKASTAWGRGLGCCVTCDGEAHALGAVYRTAWSPTLEGAHLPIKVRWARQPLTICNHHLRQDTNFYKGILPKLETSTHREPPFVCWQTPVQTNFLTRGASGELCLFTGGSEEQSQGEEEERTTQVMAF